MVHVRSKGDHEIWDYPENSTLLRPVTFIGCEKEISILHIQTNLRTLGISYLKVKFLNFDLQMCNRL
ncbi:MAG: hypothetical protein HC906_13730 [Bacteroidales bacterium]|nr:hypothetical protein [Bacteroidales bacterium]